MRYEYAPLTKPSIPDVSTIPTILTMDKTTIPKAYYCLAKAQISANHHTPQKRRSSAISDREEEKRKLALSDDSIWQGTGKPTVCRDKRKVKGKWVSRFRVRLLKYDSVADMRGRPVKTPQFASELDAEAAIFEFRYYHETKESKKLVDRHVSCLERGDEPPVVPERKKRCLSGKTRAATMTQNPAFRNSIDAPLNMNPKVPGSFNKYNDSIERNPFIERLTKMVERNWSAKQKRRSDARIEKMLRDQAERSRLIETLKSKILAKNWQELFRGWN